MYAEAHRDHDRQPMPSPRPVPVPRPGLTDDAEPVADPAAVYDLERIPAVPIEQVGAWLST